jgi:hypothetical protein
VTYKLRIENWHPATLNKLMRGSIKTRIRLSRVDRNMVCGYCFLNRMPVAQGPREVSLLLTLVGRDKEGDVDAYWKSTLDSLVEARMLIDDNRQYCRLGSVDFERGERRETVITLTEI